MGRSAPRERARVRAVGVGLAAALGLAWLGFAGVHAPVRAALHVALALVLALAAAWPERSLSVSGRVLPVSRGAAALLAACAIGLVPLPRAALAVVAPGVVEARPGFAWWTLSLDPAATLGELCDLLLPLGALVAATAWGAARWRRSGVADALRAAFVAVAVVGVAHALSGGTALFGVVRSPAAAPFFAPFVDRNHLGTALVLTLPAVIAAALDVRRGRTERAAWALAALAGLATMAWIRSSGVLAAAAVVALLTLRWVAGASRAVVASLAVAGAAAGAAWIGLADPLGGATFGDRWAAWGRGITALPGYWLAGAGGGNFEAATLPLYAGFPRWAHAHQDGLEWLVEHGLVGLVAAAGAWLALRPGPTEWPARAGVLSAGVAGVAVHALVDFPLQIPALAMGAAAVWGLRRGAFEPRIEASAASVRWALGAFAALELAAATFEARTAAVERAVALAWAAPLAAPPPDAPVWRLAGEAPERDLVAAWRAEARGDRDQAGQIARHVVAARPDRADALAAAAMILARAGDLEAADAAFRRAEARRPGDWRTWVAHARATPPERRVQAWADAFARGAPPRFFEEAYRALPIGLAWLDAARDARSAEALGALLAREGDRETAALAFAQAWLLAPDAPPDPGYVGVLLDLGRPDEARSVVDAGLALAPAHLGLRVVQARVSAAQGDLRAASAQYLALADQRPDLLVEAMRAIEAADGAAAGVALADRRELTHPLPPIAALERARLHQELGQNARCVADVQRSGLLDDPRYAKRAASLLAACDRIVPAAVEPR